MLHRLVGRLRRACRPAPVPPPCPPSQVAPEPREPQGPEAEIAAFLAAGAKPWTRGYEEYKWREIATVLANDDFAQRIGTPGYGYRLDERIVELPWMYSRLNAGPSTLLDAGSALNFLPVLTAPRVADKRMVIATLAFEGVAHTARNISYIYEDLRHSCLRPGFFDCVACVSTIEHVGMDNTFLYTADESKAESDPTAYLTFLDALKDLLRPGGRLLLTGPMGRRAQRGWFQVFDGEQVSDMVERFAPTAWQETLFQYRDDRWSLATRQDVADATCFDIHNQRDYEPDFLAFSRGIFCLELTR